MLFQIKDYEKLDSEEERLSRSRQIYDVYIMKELLSCSHVRTSDCVTRALTTHTTLTTLRTHTCWTQSRTHTCRSQSRTHTCRTQSIHSTCQRVNLRMISSLFSAACCCILISCLFRCRFLLLEGFYCVFPTLLLPPPLYVTITCL